jgi:hypothetical protein
MKKESIHKIEWKLESFWLPEHRAVLDEWNNYAVTLTDFKALIQRGGSFSRLRRGRAWIVNSLEARGVLPDEIQAYIANGGFKELMDFGVKYFITIRSKVSNVTNLSITSYERHAGPAGIQLITVESLERALAFLADADAGRVAA